MRCCVGHNWFHRTVSLFVNVLLMLSTVDIGVSNAESVCIKDQGSTCKCETKDGKAIDLRPLVKADEYPLFKDQKTTDPAADAALYSYKPCTYMSEPIQNKSSPCHEVAVCQVSNGQLFNIGDKDTAQFFGEPGTLGFHIQYTHGERTTYVHLACSSSEKAITVHGETNKMHYNMTLSTKYACIAGSKPSNGLSVGSILLIVFFVLLLVYIVGGILILRLARGARGVEQIPNYQFWSEFPGLVKDGTMFLFRGCKGENDQTYDQI